MPIVDRDVDHEPFVVIAEIVPATAEHPPDAAARAVAADQIAGADLVDVSRMPAVHAQRHLAVGFAEIHEFVAEADVGVAIAGRRLPQIGVNLRLIEHGDGLPAIAAEAARRLTEQIFELRVGESGPAAFPDRLQQRGELRTTTDALKAAEVLDLDGR